MAWRASTNQKPVLYRVMTVDQPEASIVTLMVSLMLRNTSPVYMILRNWFSVVA